MAFGRQSKTKAKKRYHLIPGFADSKGKFSTGNLTVRDQMAIVDIFLSSSRAKHVLLMPPTLSFVPVFPSEYVKFPLCLKQFFLILETIQVHLF